MKEILTIIVGNIRENVSYIPIPTYQNIDVKKSYYLD